MKTSTKYDTLSEDDDESNLQGSTSSSSNQKKIKELVGRDSENLF